MPPKKNNSRVAEESNRPPFSRADLERHVRIKASDLASAEREDIVSEAMLVTLEKVAAPENPLAFAKRVANHKIADIWRARDREGSLVDDTRVVGSVEDAVIAYEAEDDDDRRERIRDECRRRFRRMTGQDWTTEIADRLRSDAAPRPSIEANARAIFDELRQVLRKADRFVAVHGREMLVHLVATVDESCRQREYWEDANLRQRDAEVDEEDHAAEVAAGALLATLREQRRNQPPVAPPVARHAIPEPREWGPATDFLRSFLLGLGSLPEPIAGAANPWPPLVEEARQRLVVRLASEHLPWDLYEGSGPMAPKGIALVTILLDACEWPALLEAKSASMAIRREENLIRGMLKRREGKLQTVIRVDSTRGLSEVVQVPIDSSPSVRAENAIARVHSNDDETDKAACTKRHAAPSRRPKGPRPRS